MTGLFSRIRSALRRPDPLREAMREVIRAQADYQDAVARGDTRRMHDALPKVQAARTNLLRLEVRQCAR